MKRVSATLLWAALVCSVIAGKALSAEAGRSADDAVLDPPKPCPYVSIVERVGGERVLLVRYPWRRHERASIEVRLLTPAERDADRVLPLAFFDGLFHGQTRVDVYRALDESANVPLVRQPLRLKETDFEILAWRNGLGKPAVCVASRTEVNRQKGALAVYCLLEAWADDDRALYLELPATHFASPGRLWVCFLRDARVVWSGVVDWPGKN